MKNKAKFVALSGLMAALTALATMIIQIPTPQTRGYVNLGDTMVMMSGMLFGPVVGFLAGGIGSAAADVLSGYAHWAPFTFIIKGTEGAVVGLSYKRGGVLLFTATVIAGILMVAGYFIVEVVLYGFGGAIAELPGNTFQAISGIVFANIVGRIIRKLIE